jgi:hypothetical protein
MGKHFPLLEKEEKKGRRKKGKKKRGKGRLREELFYEDLNVE